MSDEQISILIVDDNIDNLRSLAAILSSEGYKVRKAISGEIALETARSHPPDLILLDIKMPHMDGYTVCYTLKQDTKTCFIPVIFLSALNEVSNKLKAFDVGGVDYITKPFQASEVIARVENQLRIKELSQQLVEQNKQLTEEIQIRQQTECALHQALEEAEAANRAKTIFLANMTHELRSPLTGILGYAQLLQTDTQCTPLQTKGLTVIYQCGNHLLTLINDILDLSKIEANKIILFPEYIDFYLFLNDLIELFRFKSQEKKIEFICLFMTPLPAVIYVEEKRLRQVLINLLSNAIKFTHKGTVTFKISTINSSCDIDDSQANLLKINGNQPKVKVKIRFEIEDTGIGIMPDQQQRIFLPFEQVMEKSNSPEGTGLGLTISKRILDLMGSQIFMESTPGVGSKFWFDLDVITNSSVLDFTRSDNTHPEIAFQSQNLEPESDSMLNTVLTKTKIPPLKELLKLYEAAQIGDVEGVQQQIDRLEELTPDYLDFVIEIQQFASNFEYEKIVHLIHNFHRD